MGKKKKGKKGKLCPTCGQPLQRKKCSDCGGRGFERVLLFFKRTCSTCQGKGKVWQCPDEWDHVMAKYRVERPISTGIGLQGRSRVPVISSSKAPVVPPVRIVGQPTPPPITPPIRRPASPPASPPITPPIRRIRPAPITPPPSPPITPPVRKPITPPIRIPAAPPASPPATPPVKPPVRPPVR
jgi:hypothetical protein